MIAPVEALVATVVVLAHHLNGPLALAFALPPILVVAGVVLFLRSRDTGEEEEFECPTTWTTSRPGSRPAASSPSPGRRRGRPVLRPRARGPRTPRAAS